MRTKRRKMREPQASRHVGATPGQVLFGLADVRTGEPLSSDQYAPLEKRDPGGGVEQITKKKVGEKTPPLLNSVPDELRQELRWGIERKRRPALSLVCTEYTNM